jgi:hypothetical protein
MKGTVIKRGAKWAVVVDIGKGPGGRRIRKWHSGYERRKDAEAARVEILSRLAQGVYVPPSRQTVADWMQSWLEGRQGSQRPPEPHMSTRRAGWSTGWARGGSAI